MQARKASKKADSQARRASVEGFISLIRKVLIQIICEKLHRQVPPDVRLDGRDLWSEYIVQRQVFVFCKRNLRVCSFRS